MCIRDSVSSLSTSGSQFPLLREEMLRRGFDEQTNLLVRKEVYPYAYVDSIDRFNETSPVSYTHLDVYKRQIQLCGPSQRGTKVLPLQILLVYAK